MHYGCQMAGVFVGLCQYHSPSFRSVDAASTLRRFDSPPSLRWPLQSWTLAAAVLWMRMVTLRLGWVESHLRPRNLWLLFPVWRPGMPHLSPATTRTACRGARGCRQWTWRLPFRRRWCGGWTGPRTATAALREAAPLPFHNAFTEATAEAVVTVVPPRSSVRRLQWPLAAVVVVVST